MLVLKYSFTVTLEGKVFTLENLNPRKLTGMSTLAQPSCAVSCLHDTRLQVGSLHVIACVGGGKMAWGN